MSISNTKKTLISSTGIFLLSLLFTVSSFPLEGSPQNKKVAYELAVLEIVPPRTGQPFYMVTFGRSQRHYKLLTKNASKYLGLLRWSGKTHHPVLVERAREESDTILAVKRVTRQQQEITHP